MDSILDYFISLQESEPAELPERAIERWNKRADFWEGARKKKEKGDERVISAINYLDSKGLLEKNYDVADIGCGPGRFAAAFAKYVHKVVGLDISDKMVKHGMEHIQNEGLNNAILYTCNFQTLDIDFLMEHMLPSEEHTQENANKIMQWIQSHLNKDGQIKEITDSTYGRILWDVRNKTIRPDYRTIIK